MLTDEEKAGLGVALNEATLLGFEFAPDRKLAAATFKVLTLPEKGPPPDDCRIQCVFKPVGRLVASLRNGLWNEQDAAVETFSTSDLLKVVESFKCPIYGWEFFDCHDYALKLIGNRVSLSIENGQIGQTHSMTLFQEGANRHLDLIVWFDEIELFTPAGHAITIAEFIAGGKRWWDGLYADDHRTKDRGIYPMGSKQ